MLAAEERLPDFALTAELLAAARGLNRDEAAKAARHCWGFLGKDLDAAGAEELLRQCAARGVEAVKIPASDLPKLEAPRPITKFAPGTEPLGCTGPGGKGGPVPISDIRVLTAAPIKTETSRMVTAKEGPSDQERAVRIGIMAVTGLPIGLGRSKEVQKEVKSAETAFYMDLVLSGGARLRFCSDNFDFSHLCAEKTYSSQVNFRLTALKLAALAPGALKNTGLWAMLEGKSLSALPYDSFADFELESLRLLALARLKS